MCPPATLASTGSSTTHPTIPISEVLDFIPSTSVSKSAFDHASSLLSPAILNHSLRVYLYAKLLTQHSNSTYYHDTTKHDLLFTSCIMHDIGTTSRYDGPQRFEVEGADAAVNHLLSHGFSEADTHESWTAIALHTSPGIAERINELTRTVRQAVLIDFGRGEEIRAEIETFENLKLGWETRLPRLGIERVLGDAVVEQAVKNPGKAPPASWPNNLYKAYLADPEWEGVNKGF